MLLASLLAAVPAAAGPGLEALLTRAAQRGLDSSPAWLALLHYRERWYGATSVIDDPRFFLSPRGASDPRAELEATVRALFGADGADRFPAIGEDPRGQAPGCRFPARRQWLERELGVAAVGDGPCPDLDAALERIQPRAASLVFPTAHMNNPGSMFGHTLLRVDSEYESPLLSHAVNYAAEIDPGDNGLSYAFKGVFGFYDGYFSMVPYYEKVKQYSAMEQRDVWEYRLDLTPAEVRRMTLHAWELRGMASDYFFFDENCSYNLLFLLEVARPELRLSGGYGPWVTPLATVERILAAGLVSGRTYRPSEATRVRHTAAQLDAAGVELAERLVRGDATAEEAAAAHLPAADRARALDIAATFQQARLTAGEVSEAAYQERYLEILRARSRLPPTREGAPTVPPPAPPEEGHSSSRAYLAGGVRSGDALVEVGFRPAYHELLDPDRGFLAGSQIHFFAGAARWYPGREQVHLQRFDLVDIVSLSPRDRFFRPVSFAVRAGLRSKPFGADEDGLVGAVAGGGGMAWRGAGALWYGLAGGEVDLSGRYAGGVGAGLGGSGGVLAELTPAWKVQLEGRAVPYLLGSAHPDLSLRLGQSLRLARNHSLFLVLERSASAGVGHTEATLRWNRYF